MKRFIIILVLFSFVVLISIGNMIYVKKSIEELNNSLKQTIEYAKHKDFETANQVLLETDSLWNKHRKIYAIFIEQDLLDEVDNQMALLKALMLYHKEEFLPQAMLCLSHLEEINQRESISYYSWF